MSNFINRSRDLSRLNEAFDRTRAEFHVLYGRRRIGKTSLLRHWVDDVLEGQHLYWTAHRTTNEALLEGFSEAILSLIPDVAVPMQLPNWEAAFKQLFRLAEKRRLVAVIDEFPYLVESVPEIPTLLQKLWDQHKSKNQIFLILCGSHYHMMHEQFASSKKPLFGRATESLVLEEIEPGELPLFLPNYSWQQIVETYGVIGGVPAYLELWDDRRPVERNIRELILSGKTFFTQEALMLVQDEIAEPRTYLALLEGLGARLSTPSTLAKSTGIAINHVGKYLKTLVDLRFIRRVISEDVEHRTRTRISRYEIRDPFLRFYFHYLYPNANLVGIGDVEKLAELVKQSFPSYVGSTSYEEFARRKLKALGDGGNLPFVPKYIGRAWTKKVELDVVGVSWTEKAVIFGECKWRSTKVGVDVLDDLIARSQQLQRLAGFKHHYALFSKSGFTAALTQRATNEGVLLFQGPLIDENG